uniref:Vesicle transport protein n=1 Tax=Timema californicum TaxID=61474 RepID=A0A7R9J1K5_TIMCA|nr:unnamed protein product [Timema californicum]
MSRINVKDFDNTFHHNLEINKSKIELKMDKLRRALSGDDAEEEAGIMPQVGDSISLRGGNTRETSIMQHTTPTTLFCPPTTLFCPPTTLFCPLLLHSLSLSHLVVSSILQVSDAYSTIGTLEFGCNTASNSVNISSCPHIQNSAPLGQCLLMDATTLSWSTRIKGFIICFVCGILCSLLGSLSMFLGKDNLFCVRYPLLLARVTLHVSGEGNGDVCGLLYSREHHLNREVSRNTCFLMGPFNQVKKMFAPTRVIATILVIVLFGLTLFAAIGVVELFFRQVTSRVSIHYLLHVRHRGNTCPEQ